MSDATYAIDAGKIFTLFFVTLGPLKLLGPFARATASLDHADLRGVAVRISALSVLIAVAGGFLGRALLEKWHVEVAALELAAGLILFMVAFQLVLEPYATPAPNPPPSASGERPAALRLVVPMVLTPYGIASVIALLALSRDAGRTVVIVSALLAVMLLNLLAMVFVRPILRGAGALVQALGAVLGVLQVALAVEIVLVALRGLGVLAGRG